MKPNCVNECIKRGWQEIFRFWRRSCFFLLGSIALIFFQRFILKYSKDMDGAFVIASLGLVVSCVWLFSSAGFPYSKRDIQMLKLAEKVEKQSGNEYFLKLQNIRVIGVLSSVACMLIAFFLLSVWCYLVGTNIYAMDAYSWQSVQVLATAGISFASLLLVVKFRRIFRTNHIFEIDHIIRNCYELICGASKHSAIICRKCGRSYYTAAPLCTNNLCKQCYFGEIYNMQRGVVFVTLVAFSSFIILKQTLVNIFNLDLFFSICLSLALSATIGSVYSRLLFREIRRLYERNVHNEFK